MIRVIFIPQTLPVEAIRLDVREGPGALVEVALNLGVGEEAVVILVDLLKKLHRPLPHCRRLGLFGRLASSQAAISMPWHSGTHPLLGLF